MNVIPASFLEALAAKRGMSDSEREVFFLAVHGKSTSAIAKELKISPEAVRKRLSGVYNKFNVSEGGPGKLVKLQQVLESEYQASADTAKPIAYKLQDWGEAPSIHSFYGREIELSQLKKWIKVEDKDDNENKCRLIALLGMGGVGKTTLSVKLVKEVKDDFESIIWRSLRNAPPVEEMLANLIQFLSNGQETDLPENVNDRITLLINNYLREHRNLLVLDNAETILRSGERAGEYREGFEGYGELLRRIGSEYHNSCLVLTSREKPKELAPLEGEASPVRSFYLPGLEETDVKEVLKDKGLHGSEEEWKQLIDKYSGNPLTLKLVSEPIRELFDGSISTFLNEGEIVFGDTRDLLNQQFERLSKLEQEIMYWLAIKRESVSLLDLLDVIVHNFLPKRQLLEALESLGRRSLLEKSNARFTLQPAIMEYVIDRLCEQVFQEITSEKIGSNGIELFMNHALIEAQAKEYLRQTQVRRILEPVAQKLLNYFGSKETIEEKLSKIISDLRKKYSVKPGYAGGNIINLLCQLEIDLTRYNFSKLTVWQAYLQNVSLHEVNFAGSNLAKSVFAETLGNISSVAFSPDGKFLATGDANDEIRLWQVSNRKSLLTCTEHKSRVRFVTFSPDGSTLASASDDQTIILWDVQTGQCLKILRGHENGVWSVAFSPDGSTLASASDDRTVRLWDAQTGQCLNILLGHENGVWSVTFSPDGKKLASCSEDCTVSLWDISEIQEKTKKCLDTLKGDEYNSQDEYMGRVPTVVCSPDGTTLASGSDDRTVKLELIKTLKGHKGWVRTVAFSPDGTTLASGSDDQTVKFWNLKEGKCVNTLKGHKGWVRTVAFSPDGTTFASGSDDRTVRLWDVKEGKCDKTLKDHTSRIWSIAFSPNEEDKVLASGSDDQTVKLWNTETGKCDNTLHGRTNQVWSVAFARKDNINSSDNYILAIGSEDRQIRLYDVDIIKGKFGEYKTFNGHKSGVWSVAFSPDSRTLASASDDQTIILWDVETGQSLKILRGHTSCIRSVAFSPDGTTLASGSDDQKVRLWDVETGQCIKIMLGHSSIVWSVAFSPDGSTLASGSEDHKVKLWNVKEGKCVNTLKGHGSWVLSVAFSANSNILASGSDDKTVKLWNTETGKCDNTLKGHTSRIWSVAFSPDGKTLASASDDQTVKLWDIKNKQPLKILQQEHTLWVRTVDFSNNEVLASGSEDGTIKLWHYQDYRSKGTREIEKLYEGMNVKDVIGLTKSQYKTLKDLGAVEE